MRTNTSLTLFAGFALIAVLAGCHRERGCTDRNATNFDPTANVDNGTCRYNGQVTFWFNTSGPDATVTINGATAVVSGYYTNGTPNCGDQGTATFTLPQGTYNYTATSTDFTWSGQITVYGNQCTTSLLTQSYGNVSFWTSTNYPNLTVTIGNQTQSVTSYYTSGSPNDCTTSGNANFTLPAGHYTFHAVSGSNTWSQDFDVAGNDCQLFHLN